MNADLIKRMIVETAIDDLLKSDNALLAMKFLDCCSKDHDIAVTSIMEVLEWIDAKYKIGYQHMNMREKYLMVRMIYTLSKSIGEKGERQGVC